MAMNTCHLCWARQHGVGEREVRRPGPANTACTQHMRRMPTRFVCDACGESIVNTAGEPESMDEAVSLLGELMAYLTSEHPDAEEDRRDLEGTGPPLSTDVPGVYCHGCWHAANPEARHERDEQAQGVCAYHGYQELIPEGLYHCEGCDRGMILLHDQTVTWIRDKFEMPTNARISRDEAEHQAIRDFMYEYAEMQEITRRN